MERGQSEQRQQRLDALFADQPFLSPTMKAQRLMDRLRGGPELAEIAAAPPAAFPAMRPAEADESRPPAAEAGPRVRLEEAAAFLRAGGKPMTLPPPAAGRLLRFREQVLPRWMERMPPKEIRCESLR